MNKMNDTSAVVYGGGIFIFAGIVIRQYLWKYLLLYSLNPEVWYGILYCVTLPISVTDRRCFNEHSHNFTHSCPGRRDNPCYLPVDGREMVTVS